MTRAEIKRYATAQYNLGISVKKIAEDLSASGEKTDHDNPITEAVVYHALELNAFKLPFRNRKRKIIEVGPQNQPSLPFLQAAKPKEQPDAILIKRILLSKTIKPEDRIAMALIALETV